MVCDHAWSVNGNSGLSHGRLAMRHNILYLLILVLVVILLAMFANKRTESRELPGCAEHKVLYGANNA
jgi:hypothetical protein